MGGIKHRLNAIQNVGQLVALPFCAWFCDRYGRRPGLVAGAAVVLVGVALQGGAQNAAMFIAARGVVGLGLALNITAAPLLVAELAHPAQRAPLVCVYNSLWGLGALAAAWTTYGTFRLGSDWAWRVPSLLQVLASGPQVLLGGVGWLGSVCVVVEESPRWLVAQGRDEEAKALLVKYHADGDASDPLVALEMEEIRAALRLEEAYSSQAGTSYLSFFQTPGSRKRFWIILAVSFFSQVREISFSYSLRCLLGTGLHPVQLIIHTHPSSGAATASSAITSP